MPQMGDPLILCHCIISPGRAILGLGVSFGMFGLKVARLGAGIEPAGDGGALTAERFVGAAERLVAFLDAADLVDAAETEALAVVFV